MEAQNIDQKVYNEIFYFFASNGFDRAFHKTSFYERDQIELACTREMLNRRLTAEETEFIKRKHEFLSKKWGGNGYAFFTDNVEQNKRLSDWQDKTLGEFRSVWETEGRQWPKFVEIIEKIKNRS